MLQMLDFGFKSIGIQVWSTIWIKMSLYRSSIYHYRPSIYLLAFGIAIVVVFFVYTF